MPPPPIASRPGKQNVEVVRALYAYQAQHADELSFEEGDNKLGDTPLHCAAWGDHEEVVRLLLSCEGIDVTIRNGDGLKSVDLAKGDKVAALLMQHQGSYQVQDMGADSDED
ncbi:hypothetical protein HDV02_004210 [Globomyces sp. JEL0801]|nr:hypothetical protein HDV02_004210 [Globomyces sp. JEL0801]